MKMAIYKRAEAHTEKEKVQGIIIGVLCLAIFVGIFAVLYTSKNLKEYNRHMCVDVYGKDENCK